MKHIHKAQKPSADLLMAHVKMIVFQWLADRDDKDLDIWQIQSVHVSFLSYQGHVTAWQTPPISHHNKGSFT